MNTAGVPNLLQSDDVDTERKTAISLTYKGAVRYD